MALFRDAFTLFLMYCFFIIQLKTFVIIVVVDLLLKVKRRDKRV